MASIELTILMPCLDEAETVGQCVEIARDYLRRSGVVGEVLVADNGSTDGSKAIAEAAGARVIEVPLQGYGAALTAGIEAADGEFVIMGDADGSYDFSALDPFLAELRRGSDLVMGNRFAGGIGPGAMPRLHRYFGNPFLTGLGRLFFRTSLGDFHCGLRGMRRTSILGLELSATGMEFASEMVAKAVISEMRISEVPTTLSPAGRTRAPHLRSFRDGWRHLRFLLLFCPNWLYLVPGFAVMFFGLALATRLVIGPLAIGTVVFDVGTLIYATILTALGHQAIVFGYLAKAYAHAAGFLPTNTLWPRVERRAVEVGLVAGTVLLLAGIGLAIASFVRWWDLGFGRLDTAQHIRVILPAALGLLLGVQTVLGATFLGAMHVGRRSTSRRPGEAALID